MMKFSPPKNMFNDSIQSKFNEVVKIQDTVINYIQGEGKDTLDGLASGELYDGAYKNRLILVNDFTGQPLITIIKEGKINQLRPFSPLNVEHLNEDMDIVHHIDIEDIQFFPVSNDFDVPVLKKNEQINLDKEYIELAEKVYEETLNIVLNNVRSKAAKELPGIQNKWCK